MPSMLSAFISQPSNIRFESQEANETIILLLRAHPITTLKGIVIGILLALVPFLLFIQPIFFPLPLTPSDLHRFYLIITMVFELVAIGYTFEQFLLYYFSVYIVTNIRVVDIYFSSLLSKKVSETQLGEIEDVTYTQNGVFRSIFNFGDVIIQTAGPNPEFRFYAVPRPNEVTQIIEGLEPVAAGGE